MNIWTFIPYSPEKDLVSEYNAYMELIPDGDWACFMDHDAMFTTYDWHNQMLDYIKDYPKYSCFVVSTNRCGSKKQIRFTDAEDDIGRHRLRGGLAHPRYCEEEFEELTDFTKPEPAHFSAVCFLLSKKAWRTVGGFKSWSKSSNILGIDSRLHQDLYMRDLKTGIMEGVYVYHWYRGGTNNKDHLK